jgi:hypothetical protein
MRSKIILACADGGTNVEVAKDLGVHLSTVGKWLRRFLQLRLDGLICCGGDLGARLEDPSLELPAPAAWRRNAVIGVGQPSMDPASIEKLAAPGRRGGGMVRTA